MNARLNSCLTGSAAPLCNVPFPTHPDADSPARSRGMQSNSLDRKDVREEAAVEEASRLISSRSTLEG